MICREARFQDIPRMVDLGMQEYPKTIYAREGIKGCADVMRRAVELYMFAPNCKTWVLDKDESIKGMLIGAIEPTYFAEAFFATDKMYVVAEDAQGHGLKMFMKFVSWAKSIPNVVAIEEILAAGMPDQSRTAQIFERIGFKDIGSIFHMEVK